MVFFSSNFLCEQEVAGKVFECTTAWVALSYPSVWTVAQKTWPIYLHMKIERLRPFCLSRTKFNAAWMRNNDIFCPSREVERVENKLLFLTKGAMNFVRERQNGRKRYSHDFEYQKL